MNPTLEKKARQPRMGLPAFENILFCTDFSPISVAAAQVALQLCEGREARLSVMHVSEYGPMPAITEEGLNYVMGLAEKEHENLNSATEEFLNKGIQASPIFMEGSATDTILEHIARCDVDLVIVGTTAAKGIDRLVFGSTAETICRRALCPVVTVGPNCAAIDRRGRPVIFATDFDDSSLDALRYAAALAEIVGSPLHVVHVLPLTTRSGADIVPNIIGEALHLVSMRIPPDGAVPRCEILHGSDVSHAVVEYARAQNAAFVVLGIRRASVAAAHLPPHRTFRIVMTSPCPVLTIGYDLRRASAPMS